MTTAPVLDRVRCCECLRHASSPVTVNWFDKLANRWKWICARCW